MTINDLYENGISIFALLQEKDVPWKALDIAGELDTIFRYIKAKNLICNSLCEDISGEALAGIVYSYNIENWKKLWQNYTVEYNPIDNYNRHEETVLTDSGNDTTVRNGSTTNTRTGSTTNTRAGSVTNTMTGTTTATDTSSVYAFNSDSSTDVSGGTSTVIPDTTTTDNYNNVIDKADYNDIKDISEINNVEDKRTLNTQHKTVSEISGNIGVTTSAQMITENINLWKWNYFDDVFDSIIHLITTGVYDYG